MHSLHCVQIEYYKHSDLYQPNRKTLYHNYLVITIQFLLHLFMCMSVCEYMHASQHICKDQRITCRSQFFPFIM